MIIFERAIIYYRNENGTKPFSLWFDQLRDGKARQIILARLTRLEKGNVGDCKHIGGGVFELRIDFGPGYRLYFGFEGMKVILLLTGGDKHSQNRDIVHAQKYWADHIRRKRNETDR